MKRRHKTRIHQIIAVLILSFAILAGGLRVNALASAARDDQPNRSYTSVMVRSGDSLWSIARTWCGSSDKNVIREYVNELRTMNHLDADGTIYPGAYLMVSVPAE